MKKLFFIFLLFISWSSFAVLQFPTNLSEADRISILETLGLGSSYKQLGDPYPLGGYSGVEVGISTEIISTGDIAKLGAKSVSQAETSYYLLSLGKGLYNNFDIFVQFAPPGQTEKVSYFGGQLRWGFYQAEYLPMHLSLSAHANSLNLQNLVITSTQGLDLNCGFTVDDLTLYLGTGFLLSQGTFLGGTGGIVTGATVQESIREGHVMAGTAFKFSKVFLALQLDHYTQSVYSAKIGLRF